jgi:hypothetical protein
MVLDAVTDEALSEMICDDCYALVVSGHAKFCADCLDVVLEMLRRSNGGPLKIECRSCRAERHSTRH